jgi:hypothetical protein
MVLRWSNGPAARVGEQSGPQSDGVINRSQGMPAPGIIEGRTKDSMPEPDVVFMSFLGVGDRLFAVAAEASVGIQRMDLGRNRAPPSRRLHPRRRIQNAS